MENQNIFNQNREEQSAHGAKKKTIFVRENKGKPVNKKAFILPIIIVLVIMLLNNSVYVVREDEVAVVRVLGDIQKVVLAEVDKETAIMQSDLDPQFKGVAIDTTKGLKFMVPFITTVEKNSEKLNTYVSNTAKINTKDKIKYDIDIYAQWRITHPGMFNASLGSLTRANSKIDEVVYAVVIDRINQLTSNNFLNNKESLDTILSDARSDLNANLASQGIKIIDIDVYRTVIPESNIESTYKKMIAERQAIAQQIRAEGLELYNNTVADTDKQVAEIVASAIEESETIRGQADAEALAIYAESFSKDPEFYEFWRTLKSYEETIDENTYLFMNKNNKYLKIFSGNYDATRDFVPAVPTGE